MSASHGAATRSISTRSARPGTTLTACSSVWARAETEKRASTKSWTLAGTLGAGRCVAQQFGDEEGVAARRCMHAVGTSPGASRQHLDGGRRQARQREQGTRARGQLAQHPPQRMRRGDLVVAVADRQQRARALDAPAQVLEPVERGVVGPMRVLHHHQHRLRGQPQFVEHGLEQRGARPVERGGEARPAFARDVEQRSERMRRLQRIAGTPPHRVLLPAAGEGAQHAGFRCPLRRDQRDASAIDTDCREATLERRHGLTALDEIGAHAKRRRSAHAQAGHRARPGFEHYRPGCAFSSAWLAASTMPSLTPNFILRGARLATITVILPIRSSGL